MSPRCLDERTLAPGHRRHVWWRWRSARWKIVRADLVVVAGLGPFLLAFVDGLGDLCVASGVEIPRQFSTWEGLLRRGAAGAELVAL